MFTKSSDRRRFRPTLSSLEDRALLNAAMPHVARGHAHIRIEGSHDHQPKPYTGPTVTVLNQGVAGGYHFTNFNAPGAGTTTNAGTNVNGISNAGVSVGVAISNSGAFQNFTTNLPKSNQARLVNINGLTTAMAFGINSKGVVVGTDGKGNAVTINRGYVSTFIPTGGKAAAAFGVNDRGVIVGQVANATTAPGFIRTRGNRYITINAPSGPNVVNAQGINNKGLVVGFYEGTDMQAHGFTASAQSGNQTGSLTATPVVDPTIPNIPGEKGATFVFSQILGINDKGIAVGYYGDSTTSQHGFIYNTNTGQYTFLDDPNAAFDNGVEVTQITGINNSGQISGFYSDANGVFHGFVGTVAR